MGVEIFWDSVSCRALRADHFDKKNFKIAQILAILDAKYGKTNLKNLQNCFQGFCSILGIKYGKIDL